MFTNVILVEGFGGVSGVREAQRFADNAKKTADPCVFAACTVILNEALNESEKVILQFIKRANEFDKQMKYMKLELKRERARKYK